MEAKLTCIGVAAQIAGVEYVHTPITQLEHIAIANDTAVYEQFFGFANEFRSYEKKSMEVLIKDKRNRRGALRADQLKDNRLCRSLG
jgi:hypothetical protein